MTDSKSEQPVPTDKKQAKSTLFQPGQSGNPNGRPKGVRNKLSDDFITALANDFEVHGIGVIEDVRTKKPEVYLKVIADLMPKDMNLNLNPNAELTDEQIIKRIQRLNDIIGPFLSDAGIRGPSNGVATPTAH